MSRSALRPSTAAVFSTVVAQKPKSASKAGLRTPPQLSAAACTRRSLSLWRPRDMVETARDGGRDSWLQRRQIVA
jgi:hypothetical protein